MMHYDDIGVTKTALHFITIPWTLSIRPDLFEGYSVQFGLYFLMFAPLAFLMRREAWVQSCAVFAFVFTTCWFFLGQSLRFLIPALPFLILVGAAGHAGITAKKGGKIAGAVVLLLLTVNLLFIGYYTRTQWPVALGMESEPAYLMRTQRSYPMAQFVNVNLSPGAKIFSSDESHLFYYDRTITREAIYQRVHHADVSGLPAKDWIARLKAEGYTHLLTVENVAAAAGQTAACASLACLLRTGELPVAEYLKPLYNYDFNYSDQALFYYQLFEIL